MPSSLMICHVGLVRTDVSGETINSIIKVTRNGELGTLALTSNRRMLQCGGDLFLQNINSYKSHTA
jgi:hypothetical protein